MHGLLGVIFVMFQDYVASIIVAFAMDLYFKFETN